MIFKRSSAIFIGASIVALASGCASVNSDHSALQLALHDHPLVGKIWDVKANRFVDADVVFDVLADKNTIVLGEIHDNVQHHLYQSEVIAELGRRQLDARIFFEMINDQQGNDIKSQGYASTDQLIEHLEATDSGWDYRHMYQPLFKQALSAGYDILPANINRQQLMTIMMQGEAHMPESVRALIDARPLSVNLQQAMAREAIEAHCNMLPEDRAAPMILAQRVRDAQMASQLMKYDRGMNVLITGNGHARRDRGVPFYMTADQNSELLSIAYMEVVEGELGVPGYASRWDDQLPFDYIWFTARFDRPDPCASLRQQLQKQAE